MCQSLRLPSNSLLHLIPTNVTHSCEKSIEELPEESSDHFSCRENLEHDQDMLQLVFHQVPLQPIPGIRYKSTCLLNQNHSKMYHSNTSAYISDESPEDGLVVWITNA